MSLQLKGGSKLAQRHHKRELPIQTKERVMLHPIRCPTIQVSAPVSMLESCSNVGKSPQTVATPAKYIGCSEEQRGLELYRQLLLPVGIVGHETWK